MQLSSGQGDFVYPGEAKRRWTEPTNVAVLQARPSTPFQPAPHVSRLLYYETKLHFDFLAGSSRKDELGLELSLLGESELITLQRLATQMKLASIQAPQAQPMKTVRKKSQLPSYCAYLQGARCGGALSVQPEQSKFTQI